MKKENDLQGVALCPPDVLRELVLVHYGHPRFLREAFEPVRDDLWFKPDGGLWTSPEGSSWGWRDWCEAERFRECRESESFRLRFREGARVILVDSYAHLAALPQRASKLPFGADRAPDFKLLARRFDALWLTAKGERETRGSAPLRLACWDCESVLVFNPDSVEEVAHER